MSIQLNEIFYSSKDNPSHLELMAEKYPWCSIAQLFLLQHYKKTNSAQFDRQATKTALYFNNHDWLSWQLNLLTQHEKNEVDPEKIF